MRGFITSEADLSGTAFRGKKFFVAQRIIPPRINVCKKIEENGGVITRTENRADIVIADHEQDDPPPGSVSIKYVYDAIESGKLPDIEKYRANSSATSICQSKLLRHSKLRTRFTIEEDEFLMKWCKRAQKEGKNLRGNKIYQELEQKRPNHTYQSWRDHCLLLCKQGWKMKPASNISCQIKSAVQMPQIVQEKRESLNLVVNPSEPVLDPARTISKQKRQGKETRPEHGQLASRLPESKESVNFTSEDNKLLLGEHHTILKVDKRHMIDFWVKWAEKHSNHTAQQWCNHFDEYMKPRIRAIIERKHSSLRHGEEYVDAAADSPKRNETLVTKVQSPINNSGQNSNFNSSSSSTPTRSPLNSYQNVINSMMPTLEDPSKFPDPMIRNEKLFQQGIRELAEQLEINIIFNPEISGIKVSLFELWRVMQLLQKTGFNREESNQLWEFLAFKLGFGVKSCDDSVIKELKDCYGEVLVGYGDLRHQFLKEMGLINSQDRSPNDDPDNFGRKFSCNEPAAIKTEEDGLQGDFVCDSEEVLNSQLLLASNLHSPKKRGLSNEISDKNIKPRKIRCIENRKSSPAEIPSTPVHFTTRKQPSNSILMEPPQNLSSAVIEQAKRDVNSVNLSAPKKQNQLIDPAASSPEIIAAIKSSDVRNNVSRNGAVKNPSTLTLNSTVYENDRHIDVIAFETQPSFFCPENRLPSQTQSRPQKSSTFCDSMSMKEDRHSEQISSNEAQPSPLEETEVEDSCSDELEVFINEWVENRRYQEKVVIEALEVTSMTIGPASHIEEVIESLSCGKGVPEGLPGVWTKIDDEALDGPPETEEYKRIMAKHGFSLISQRLQFKNDLLSADGDEGSE